jgi:post-segregation antitoxin (ccd killing protein)
MDGMPTLPEVDISSTVQEAISAVQCKLEEQQWHQMDIRWAADNNLAEHDTCLLFLVLSDKL